MHFWEKEKWMQYVLVQIQMVQIQIVYLDTD